MNNSSTYSTLLEGTGTSPTFDDVISTVPAFDDVTNISHLFHRKKKSGSHNVTAEDLESFKIADVVNLYIPPVILVAGNLCNILSIVVMRTRHFQNISTSIYMIACAINDTVSLWISLLAHWLYVNFPEAIIRTEYSHIMCKFFNFYGWGNCDYTIILTAAMTADRAFAIMYPIKASVLNLTKRAKITVSLLVIIVVAKEFHLLISSDIVPATRRDRLCDVIPISPTYKYFWDDVWPWIHITYLTVCFVVILSSNVIIFLNVRRSEEMKDFIQTGHRERSGSETSTSNAGTRSKLLQITTMLLAQSTTLILLTYPFSLHLAISSQIPDLYTDPVKKAANQLAFSVVFYLLYSNKCVNFTIYCISGERFRLALREVLCCRSSRKRHVTITMMIKPVISASQTTISSISSIQMSSLKDTRQQVRDVPG